VILDEALDVLLRTVQDHVDVIVARLPWIAEDARSVLFENRGALVAQPVERVTQGPAPLLIPSGRRADIAAAVELPTRYAVAAAP